MAIYEHTMPRAIVFARVLGAPGVGFRRRTADKIRTVMISMN